jgi:hypothetical protein
MGRLAMFWMMVRKPQLDSETADRMLAGEITPADAPPGFQAVCAALGAARGEPSRAALRIASRQTQLRSRSMIATLPHPRRLSTALATVAALAAMSGAAYATGLPGAASKTAHGVLQSLGIAVPGPNVHAGAHPNGSAPAPVDTSSSTQRTASGGPRDGASSDRQGAGRHTGEGKGKGAEISTLARTTTATGAAKGAQISAAASGGKSRAGQHGHASGGAGQGHRGQHQPTPHSHSPNQHSHHTS